MKSIMFAALAGLTTVASTQNISTNLVVELTFDKTMINIGETAVGSIRAFWDGVPGSYFSNINIDLFASGDFVSVSNIEPVSWNNPFLGFDGQATASGANILGLESTQLALFPPFNASNPIHITSFVVTGTFPGDLTYSAEMTNGFATFPFSVTGPFFSDPTVAFGTEVFVTDHIRIIPSQGGMVLMGISALLIAGRRLRK